jgi:hypothetical protein
MSATRLNLVTVHTQIYMQKCKLRRDAMSIARLNLFTGPTAVLWLIYNTAVYNSTTQIDKKTQKDWVVLTN